MYQQGSRRGSAHLNKLLTVVCICVLISNHVIDSVINYSVLPQSDIVATIKFCFTVHLLLKGSVYSYFLKPHEYQQCL